MVVLSDVDTPNWILEAKKVYIFECFFVLYYGVLIIYTESIHSQVECMTEGNIFNQFFLLQKFLFLEKNALHLNY